MPQFTSQKLPDFAQAAVLVVGDVMIDQYWFGDASRISPEAPVPIVKIQNQDYRPGGAGNVAVNISALGARAFLLGVVGEDDNARLLMKLLNEKNVEHNLCQTPNLATIIKLRILSRHQQLLRLDFEEEIISFNHDLLFHRFKEQLNKFNLVILSDYKKGTLCHPQYFIESARQANITVLVDPKGSDYSVYKNANIITPNYKEFEAVVGRCRNEAEIVEKGQALLNQYKIGNLLLTRGENGMTLIPQNKDAIHFPAYAREVFDVTGAGDTVIATLGACVAAKADLEVATALANLAASLVVGKLGATSVSVTELQSSLSSKVTSEKGIVTEDELLQTVSELRAQGKRIVFTNGCFDIFHAGHATYLQLAKQLGDYLIVAVNSDESLRKLKGELRPVNPLLHRMAVLASMQAVDFVVPFSDDTPIRLLKKFQPDLLVKGGDYDLHEIVGHEIVKAYGGEVRVIKHTITTTSTAILKHQREIEKISATVGAEK